MSPGSPAAAVRPLCHLRRGRLLLPLLLWRGAGGEERRGGGVHAGALACHGARADRERSPREGEKNVVREELRRTLTAKAMCSLERG